MNYAENYPAHLPCPGRLDLLPVTPRCPSLGTTLLFNSVRRGFAQLADQAAGAEPDWQQWMSEILKAGSLTATDLLIPEAQVSCGLLKEAFPHDTGRARHSYRRAYWTELGRNQSAYFDFFDFWKVPEWILQSLRASCEQELLFQRLEQVLDSHPKMPDGYCFQS